MEDDDDGKIVRILEKADPAKQESLDAENVVDPMDAEQTWPTAEELRLADEEQKKVCSSLFLLILFTYIQLAHNLLTFLSLKYYVLIFYSILIYFLIFSINALMRTCIFHFFCK